MEVVVLTVVLIGILLAVASGVWVAIALVRAISTRPTLPAKSGEPGGQSES
jgi:uncharacterized membrane protein